MKFEKTQVYNFEGAIRGMRNPLESWDKSDSVFGIGGPDDLSDCFNEVANAWFNAKPEEKTFINATIEEFQCDEILDWLYNNAYLISDNHLDVVAMIGPKDMGLAKRLIKGGSEHRKFLRQIMVSVDITAPLYLWKEFDTYKVGTTANSTSTMHKLATTPITIDCFEIDDYESELKLSGSDGKEYELDSITYEMIDFLERLRLKYLETKDKRYWKELIRWLPNGWLQTRTVTLNYENILNIIHQRDSHKLTEWHTFCNWAKDLPYMEEFLKAVKG